MYSKEIKTNLDIDFTKPNSIASILEFNAKNYLLLRNTSQMTPSVSTKSILYA